MRARVREVVDLPIHCEARRDRFEIAAKIGEPVFDVELDALQEEPRRGVGMLIGLDDVARGVGNEPADGRDDARAILAAQQEGGSHDVAVASEERQSGFGAVAEEIHVDFDAGHAFALGEHLGLRLDLLRDEQPDRRREPCVAIEPFLVAQQLLDSRDLTDPLHLDDDRAPRRVAAEQIDGSDVGRDTPGRSR